MIEGDPPSWLLDQIDLLVVSPGVPLEQPAFDEARKAGIPIIGELELAARWVRGRVIAITGTKGKSTTTTLASRMLTEAGLDAPAVGNIGELRAVQTRSRAGRPSFLPFSCHPWRR